MTKKRISTQLEQEGAEHLVIGNLLRFKIQSYLCPKNFEDYDLIAINPKNEKMKKVQVKSRLVNTASSFPLKKVGSDFIVFVKLNCAKRIKGELRYKYDLEPEFYIFPTKLCKEYREQKGWSQEQLAFEAGLHRTYIGHIERGEKNVGLKNLERITKTLRVNIKDLL